MARIELRDCVVRLKDGLSGTAAINGMGVMAGDTDLDIETVALNTTTTTLVPLGARFTVAGETAATTVHTVTARTPSSMGPTTNITFTPALTAGTYTDGGVLTFSSNQLEIKVGDGDVSYTINKNYNYDLDRGDLDTVREGDQAPLDVTIAFTYEHMTTGTGENVTPMDALDRSGAASEWVSSATDLCEPYAVDVEIAHIAPCGTAEDEITTFADFRYESAEVSLRDATVSLTGRCNITKPVFERE
jgi:hypothetical protein